MIGRGRPESVLEAPGHHSSESGYNVAGPFQAFYAHYGPTLCGLPISDVVVENGVRCQYFQCIALEEHEPGRVRVKAIGETLLALQQARYTEQGGDDASVVEAVDRLRRDPAQRYAVRPLSDIRYLVIHHTGAPADVGAEAIAAEHVDGNGWPGIGYHFVIDPAGRTYRTQDLTTVSYHARQFNPVSAGIALVGDLTSALPAAAQLDAAAALVARLLMDLGLPPDAVRGHREMVPIRCPGESFIRVWKSGLMHGVDARLGALRKPAADEHGAKRGPSATDG